MAILRDEEEQKGQGTSQALGQPVPDQQQVTSAPQPQTTPASGPATIGASSAPSAAPSQAMPKQQKAGTGSFSNLKNYLQAAQGGGQQKVAQAATQQVQRLGTGAQKGLQQAQQTFGTQLQAGSLAGMETAGQEAKDIIGAARGTVYQAPQPAQQQTESAPQQETSTPPQPTTPQPQQYFTPEQQQRFAEIINAQYQGPMSLQQGGLYEQAASKARTAQQAAELTQSAEGRSQLLRDVFGRSRDYSRGASRLDSLLLNASEQGVKQLQEQAQPALQSQQALQAAQNLSANEAAQRKAAIEQIQSGARTAFTGARSEEEAAADEYINNIQANWDKLPEHFKNVLMQSVTNPKTSRVGSVTPAGYIPGSMDILYDRYLSSGVGPRYNLSKEELDILGLSSGQGLFGITPDVIQAAQKASNAELITKDQLSRQLALAQLASLEKTGSLKKDLQYTDLEKAGTKNILDSLDVQKLQNIMTENKARMEKALENQNLAMATFPEGQPTKASYKNQNLLDILKAGGYTTAESQNSLVGDTSKSLLQSIAEGKGYTPQTSLEIPGYVQTAFKNLRPTINEQQLLQWALPRIQNTLSTYGGSDTVQQTENEETNVRAAALRKLLSEIYKP